MQIVKSREYRSGFRVEPWDIERLVQHLGGDENVTRVAVELGDGSSLTVPHAGALSSVPNLPARPITSVWIESAPPAFIASEESPSRLAIVQLRDRGSFGLSIHVSGDERAVRDLAANLEDWADSISPWFGRLAFMDSPGLLFRGLLGLGCLVGIALAGSTILREILPASLLSVPAAFARGTRLVALGCLVLLALGTLWAGVHPRSLFPAAQFRFGEGEARSNRSDRRRNLVLRLGGVAAAVGATGSMLAGILR